MENARKIAQVAFLFLAGGFVLSFVLYFGSLAAYLRFPERFGAHREFYRTCKGIRSGATVEQARAAMGRYLEVGRTYAPPGHLPAAMLGAAVRGGRVPPAESDSRLLFIPGADDLADWCLVYPERGRVARVEASPD